jgi:hypothetical protein
MMDPLEFLDELQPEILGKTSQMEEVKKVIDSNKKVEHVKDFGEINIYSVLKFPLLIFILGNVLFALILFLRARLLSDTFSTSQNKIAKSIIVIYIITTVVGSLLSILFLALA